MATFYNQATLTYNGTTTTSNTTTGELVDVLTVTKTALVDEYTPSGDVTYVINIINSGNTAFTGLTVTDNLGEYNLNDDTTLTPLAFNANSLQYFVNGVLQTTPAIVSGPPLVISGITVPADGNATIIYQTSVNQYAPLEPDGTITNEISVTGGSLSAPVTAAETVTAASVPLLTITKSLTPTTVTENGQITYTFTIENYGNTEADASYNAVITDRFTPILNPITVTFEGTLWSEPNNYTYDTDTGLFTTVPGQITVPAATYTQDETTGEWTVTPGVSILTVTGTI